MWTLYDRKTASLNEMLFLSVCPDDTISLDSDNDGYTIVSVGSSGSTQNAEDALESYLGTGLEICEDDYLKLTSNCPSESGYIISFTLEVMFITEVNITFTTDSGATESQLVKHLMNKKSWLFLSSCLAHSSILHYNVNTHVPAIFIIDNVFKGNVLFQFENLDPNVLTPITVQPPNAQVSMIVIETVKPQNCSIIQGIAIDQCCEKGTYYFNS